MVFILNNEEFVMESINLNLYFLRSVREFCANIELSFLSNNIFYINKAKDIALRCEEIGRELMKISNNKISQKAIDYEILTTPYTLPCEELTEKLFDIKLATDITKIEVNLKPGIVLNVTDELVKTIENINSRALTITKDFTTLCNDINKKLVTNNLFSYSYPTMYEFMVYQTSIFNLELDRLINKDKIDPLFALNYEFLGSNSMRTIALFINKLVDIKHKDITLKSQEFADRFDEMAKLYSSTSITPENQKELTDKQIDLVTEFKLFVERCITDLLNSNLYFIIEAIFFDNMLTKVNYFLYILSINREKEEGF